MFSKSLNVNDSVVVNRSKTMEAETISKTRESLKIQKSKRNQLMSCNMKKAVMLIAIFAVVGIVINGCKKNDTEVDNIQPSQKVTMQNEMIPIAKLTDKNEIEHLFLQKDVQAFFLQENPGATLVFVEVIINDEDEKEARLLYQIYYEESEITETSLELALTLEDNVCYYLSGGDNGGGGSGGIGKISCTTKACSNTNGCLPNFWGTMCSSCDRGDCTKTVSSGVSATLTNAMQYAVDVYKSYGQN